MNPKFIPVSTRPIDGAVVHCFSFFDGELIYVGQLQYRISNDGNTGSYWGADGKMKDTPSWWIKILSDNITESESAPAGSEAAIIEKLATTERMLADENHKHLVTYNKLTATLADNKAQHQLTGEMQKGMEILVARMERMREAFDWCQGAIEGNLGESVRGASKAQWQKVKEAFQ